MISLTRLLPQSLVSRVYALYSVTLLLFVGSGLWLFYHYQFSQAVEDAQQSATMLIEVVVQTISDSAVIGDYDTIKRTLDKSILRSQFASAAYIDLTGGVIKLENTDPSAIHPPAWLHEAVAEHLYDVNRNISVGGHDYGVLRLTFAVDVIAGGLWQLMQAAVGLAFASFFGGLLLIWFPLRHWLGSLERVHTFEADFSNHGEQAGLALLEDVPLEFRPTFEVLNRTAITLRNELETREQALTSLRSALSSLLPNADIAGGSDDIAVLSQMILELMRERQAQQKELELAMTAADAANKAKSEFLANMSHEIRTPMNGILGMTNLVLESDLSEEQKDLIGIVKRSADALLTIINDILDFSKIEAGKLTIEEVPFDLRQTVNEAIQPLAESAREKGLLLHCDIAPSVPLKVVGDSVRVRQVLLNLMGNAIKFTERGEVAVSCVLGASQDKKITLHFTVKDSGVGIAPEKIQHIFSAFTQEDSSTTRRFGGTGLGLTISRRFVELMHGRMWVDSQLGAGSRFHFTIGVGEALADDPVAVITTANVVAAAPAANHGLSVLLVEDHPVNQKLARMLLERRGYRVTLAENGREAVSEFAQGSFAVVLMDMHMPEMDGIEATVAIRALEQAEQRLPTPIVAMTANAMQADRERCIEAGMDDYLSKPINAAELFSTLERIVSR